MNIIEELENFSKLEGWSFGEAGPISSLTISKAKDLYNKLKCYNYNVEVFPGLDDDIAMSFQDNEYFFEIEIDIDKETYNTWIEYGIGTYYEVKLLGELREDQIINMFKDGFYKYFE